MSSFRKRPILVRVGRVLKPFGVRGQLKCAYTTDNPALLADRSQYLLVEPRSHECQVVTTGKVQLLPANFLIKFIEYDAPEPLKRFAGWELMHPVYRGELPRGEGEVYYFELEGMTVRHLDGYVIGKVRAIRETPAHILLELDCPGEPLIPYTKMHIPEINLEEGWMVTGYELDKGEADG